MNTPRSSRAQKGEGRDRRHPWATGPSGLHSSGTQVVDRGNPLIEAIRQAELDLSAARTLLDFARSQAEIERSRAQNEILGGEEQRRTAEERLRLLRSKPSDRITASFGDLTGGIPLFALGRNPGKPGPFRAETTVRRAQTSFDIAQAEEDLFSKRSAGRILGSTKFN